MDIAGYEIEVYKYKLKEGYTGYIPIILVISHVDIPHGTSKITIKGKQYLELSVTSLYLGLNFPLWTVRANNYNSPCIYNYEDDYFQFLNDDSIKGVNPYIKYSSSRTIQYYPLLYDYDIPAQRGYGGSSFIPVFVTDQRRDFYYCSEANDSYTVSTFTYQQDGAPLEAFELPTLTSKGSFLGGLQNVRIPFITGSYYSTYANQYNITIGKILGDSTLYDAYNPYPGGDESENPGDGQFDYGGDEIDIPDLPSVSVTDSGFVSLFAPTNAQLQALGSYLWSDAFSIESFKKMFNNPMDCILGLSIVPVNLPTGSAKEITVGNVVSTVKCNVCTNQYVKVDCGTFTVSPTKFTGGYLDYSPYTKCYIYLPFIGIQQLNIDDVMNSTIHCVYHVDILTGACVCFLKMTNRISGGNHAQDATLYSFSGQCAESVPLSASSFSNTMGSILTAAGAIGGAVATIASGGAAAPVAGALTTAATSTANAATSMKPNVQHSGSLGGSSGFMGIRYPFMIFDAPHTAIPSRQYLYTGYPSNSVTKIKNLSGFNVIQAVNLEVKGALDTECDMIKSILLSGVII